MNDDYNPLFLFYYGNAILQLALENWKRQIRLKIETYFYFVLKLTLYIQFHTPTLSGLILSINLVILASHLLAKIFSFPFVWALIHPSSIPQGVYLYWKLSYHTWTRARNRCLTRGYPTFHTVQPSYTVQWRHQNWLVILNSSLPSQRAVTTFF